LFERNILFLFIKTDTTSLEIVGHSLSVRERKERKREKNETITTQMKEKKRKEKGNQTRLSR